MPSIHSYLQEGRLSDVLALIQVLAFDRDTYRSEGGLQEEFQRKPITGESWMAVARQHPEFFRVRNIPQKEPRVALLARYVLPKEQTADGDEKKPPLEPDLVNKLLELAVDLHDKQSERASRWRNVIVPVIIAAIAAGASVASAIIGLAKPSDAKLVRTPADQGASAPSASSAASTSPTASTPTAASAASAASAANVVRSAK